MTILERLGFGPTRSHHRTADGWLVEVKPPQWSGFQPCSIVLKDYEFENYQRWLHGEGLIQDLLPDLSNEQREILMTGIGPAEWDKEFGE